MRIENGKKVRSRRGNKIPTKIVSFRAEPCVLEMLDKQRKLENKQKSENIGRSEFILRVLTEYCEKYGNRE